MSNPEQEHKTGRAGGDPGQARRTTVDFWSEISQVEPVLRISVWGVWDAV